MNGNNNKYSEYPAAESLVSAEHVQKAIADLKAGNIGAFNAAKPLQAMVMNSAHDLAENLTATGMEPGMALAVAEHTASLAIASALAMRHALWNVLA